MAQLKPFRYMGDDELLQGDDAWEKCDAAPGSGDVLAFSGICLEGYPCQHYVRINGVDEARLWGGLRIVAWCQKAQVEVPKHFKEYAAKPIGYTEMVGTEVRTVHYDQSH
jgi:hypothetical protein